MSILQKISAILEKQLNMLIEPVIGHSRVVSLTKMVLLVIAGIMIAVLIIWPFSNPVNKNFKLSFSGVEKNNSDAPKMINPHLQGVDGNNQTYNITAKSAIQESKDRIILKGINADINLQNNSWIYASADEGVFDHSENMMDLNGNINVFNSEGYEFSTNEAHVDINKSIISGNTQIKGQGPMGNISADNFYVERSGGRILLTGNVKLVLFFDKK